MSEAVWNFVSVFGDVQFWAVFVLAFFIFYMESGKKEKQKIIWVYKLLLPSIVFSATISFVLKLVLHVPRICDSLEYCPFGFSLPSMHAAVIFALFGSIALYTRNPIYSILSFALAVFVSMSRVFLGVHTLFDIITGASIGVSTSVIWFIFYQKILSIQIRGIRPNHFYFRKLIHFSGFLFFAMYFFVPKPYLIAFLATITLFFLVSEIFRVSGFYFPVVQELTVYCSKKEETKRFVIAPLLFFLAMLVISIFPEKSFIAGSISLIIGDTAAGIFGYTFGKIRLPYNRFKTLEGSLACLVSVFISLLFFFDFRSALLLSIFSSVVESLFVRYENFCLPVTVAVLALFF